MKRNAFTMLELVMAIVVIGILAALAMPRIERDLRQDAGDNILSAIRQTQHLALNDNKTNPNSLTWQQTLWQIRFSNGGGEWWYTIGANNDQSNNLDQAESAFSISTGKFLHSTDASPADPNESKEIFLTAMYGINGVAINDCTTPNGTAAMHIAFDYLGRPHGGVTQGGGNDFGTLVTDANGCTLTFTFADGSPNLNIRIERETGYAFIVGQPNS